MTGQAELGKNFAQTFLSLKQFAKTYGLLQSEMIGLSTISGIDRRALDRAAVTDFTKALEIDPGMVRHMLGRAIACYSLKNYDRAWEDVYKAQSRISKSAPDFFRSFASLRERQIDTRWGVDGTNQLGEHQS